uniref:Major facilitator superfamily (MFS) profile domain-containing protein n=1 Tax=Kwoniella dejecticola CBS 10117 TaxID=1296121 RepID=A0A1A6A012_9TREE|nr:uncharacterized protein I303_05673 [Kwoniella dejecticola CBS 10117]OBR83395.1 hypothetical protein I303_05673 [Kwoniella dejecticola CBS 10117]
MSEPKIADTSTSDHHTQSGVQEKHHKLDIAHNEHAPSATPSDTQIGFTPEDRDERLAARATLQNALHGIPKTQLLKESDEFCDNNGLSEFKGTFRKGALLAQKPKDWDLIDELNPDEKAAIKFEHEHKWRMSRDLLWVVGACAIGAAVQGWDQTGSNGANLSFPQEFGIARGLDEPGGAHDQWILGLVNAIPYLSAPIIGCYSSDPLNNLFGRRGAIFISAIILIATPIAMGFTHTWQELLIVRIFFGIGIGLKGSTIPIFSAEVAPTVIRGALVMFWQLWTTIGIFVGFSANAIVKDTGTIAWRLQIGSSFIPAVPLAIMIWFCPESPRWYMRKGKMSQAFKSMRKLRRHDVQAARDLFYAWVQWEAEKKVIGDRSMFRRFMDLFTVPRIRRATLAASVLHAGQDLCGINTIAFYSSTIFVEGGATNAQALYASLGFGALNFVFTWPAIFTIDTFGRRTLNLFFFPLMAVSLLAAGEFYFSLLSRTAALTTRFIYIYTIFYSIGEGPIIFTYSAEVFPLAHRELGQAFPVSINYFVNFLLSLWFPFQLKQFGGPGTFGFYTGTNILAFCLAFLFMRETKQLTLEELDQVFSVPTSVYVNYQFTKWIPWAFKRYILFNKRVVLEPLFYEDKDIKA